MDLRLSFTNEEVTGIGKAVYFERFKDLKVDKVMEIVLLKLISKYSKYINDVCLAKMSKEFLGGEKIKFVRNKAEDKVDEFSKTFDKEVEELNHETRFNRMKTELSFSGRIWRGTKVYKGRSISKEEMVTEILDEWRTVFLRRIDEMIVMKVGKEVTRTSKLRCEINETVFNFSGKDVPNEILNKLSFGSNYVIHTRTNETEARTKMETELLSYLRKYRKFILRKPALAEDDVVSWLDKAREIDKEDYEQVKFYTSLITCLAIDMGVPKRIEESKVEFKVLDNMGICVVEADKGMGIVLLDVNKLATADRLMVRELGGTECDEKTSEDVTEAIRRKVENFESSAGVDAKKFLNTYYDGRMDKYEESMTPFLKLRPKLHKMNHDELKQRN